MHIYACTVWCSELFHVVTTWMTLWTQYSSKHSVSINQFSSLKMWSLSSHRSIVGTNADTAKGFGSVTLWQKVLFFFFQEVKLRLEIWVNSRSWEAETSSDSCTYPVIHFRGESMHRSNIGDCMGKNSWEVETSSIMQACTWNEARRGGPTSDVKKKSHTNR